jgi:hypothetical protein
MPLDIRGIGILKIFDFFKLFIMEASKGKKVVRDCVRTQLSSE